MRLRCLPICICLLLSAAGALPLPGQGFQFLRLDNLRIPDGSLNMIRTQEGNFVSAGYWEDRAWMARFNACGALVWSETYRRGQSQPRMHDLLELPDGRLIAAGLRDTLQPIPELGRLPVTWLLETDPCGEVLRERILTFPASGVPAPFEVWSPSAGYAIDTALGGGYFCAGQALPLSVGSLIPLNVQARKAPFLCRLDADLQPVQYSVFPQIPQADSLVAYDVLALPDGGAIIAGAWFDAAQDSNYIFAIRTDAQLNPVWQRKWYGAPTQLNLSGQLVNYSFYHTGTSLALTPSGTVILGGTRFVYSLDFLDAFLIEIDPASGTRLRERRFPNWGLDIGLRVRTYANGILFSGGQAVYDGTGWALASVVHETDLQLAPRATYLYTDSSEYFYLATSIIPLDSLAGQRHALAGVRYLSPGGITLDSSNSIVFLNAAVADNLPLTPEYYGGVIVQIEDVNVRDTIECRPSVLPAGCQPLSTGIRLAAVPGRLRAYPNPAQDLLRLELPAALSRPAQAVLTDPLGRAVARFDLRPGLLHPELSLAGLPPGAYDLELEGLRCRLIIRP
ncbi:MAG: hypothetical protein NW241_06670 [Bacteroidia bacterium]|nr:hypothetical protein [Bacteroidia bacterium]